MDIEPKNTVKKQNGQFWNLVVLFEIIFLIKLLISLTKSAPDIIPDEPCVILRAIHFIRTFKLEDCGYIAQIPTGANPHPLYSIIISPIYLFTYGTKAFHAALGLNVFLTASLVFPLYSIFSKFIKNTKTILVGIGIILFLPQIIYFENTMMTESIFTIINIWFLYFYIKSFDENKWPNKIAAALLAIFASFSRPFGFIVLISMVVNEIFLPRMKGKKIFLTITAILTAITIWFTLRYINPDMINLIKLEFTDLNKLESWQNILRATVRQINSFSITTYLIPLVLFFHYIISEKNDGILRHIKKFLLVFIFLNFAISAHHIYGYLRVGDDPGLITRYVNVSIIYIYIFAFIFFSKSKKMMLNKYTFTISILLIFSLLCIPDTGFKNSLNPDLGIYHVGNASLYGKDIRLTNALLKYYFSPFVFLLLILLVLGTKKIISILLISVLTINALFLIQSIPYGLIPPTVKLFQHTEEDIAFIMKPLETSKDLNYQGELFELTSMTKNRIHTILLNKREDLDSDILDKNVLEKSKFFKQSKYIISPYKIDLTPIALWSLGYLYINDVN